MRWSEERLAVVDAALEAARAGTPTVLSIEGEPGQGKSTLLREVVRRADGFHVLATQGEEGASREPFTVLRAWGARDVPPSPFQAAQRLRELVEQRELTGPVLLVLDDLQWIDPESVETVSRLVGGAFGDRLLVAAASRPPVGGLPAPWRRLLLDHPDVVTCALSGLALDETLVLVRALEPAADPSLVARLWEHTGGNPLYLRVLLQEHGADELASMERLPAPADVAASLRVRLEHLSPDGAALARALAVLGTGWSTVTLAGELAGVRETSAALEALTRDGLVETRSSGTDTQARIYHSLVRAAIYEDIPAVDRRATHLRAAALLSSPASVLEHRVAAADRYDETLAEDLTTFADQLHAAHAYREAARHLRWASGATADPAVRERRWLDALFESTLARDVDEVTKELTAVSWARDETRRTLVQGYVLVVTKRWLEAVHLFEGIPDEQLAEADPRVQFRVRTLRGWVRVVTGSATDALPELTVAVRQLHVDPALATYVTFAYGQAQMRVAAVGGLWGVGDDEEAETVPASAVPEVYQAAWRGSVYALSGMADVAVRELEQFRAGVESGHADVGDGVFHSLLGFAHWMRGDLRRAHIAIGIATDARFGALHPMVQAIAPLASLTVNEPDTAAARVRAARESLERAPWPQGILAATIVDVLVLRLTGTDDARRRYLRDLRRAFGPPDTTGAVPPLWILHLAMATVWSGETDEARALADLLTAVPADVPWSPGAADWVRALAAEADGRAAHALDLLAQVGRGGLDGLPVHTLLAASDLARVAAAEGDRRTATAANATVTAGFAGLGIAWFAPEASSADDVLALLSAREKDVVALLADGLNYVQIAKELFVTRSTVAFHLSRAYAKTGTSSRHELVELLRSSS